MKCRNIFTFPYLPQKSFTYLHQDFHFRNKIGIIGREQNVFYKCKTNTLTIIQKIKENWWKLLFKSMIKWRRLFTSFPTHVKSNIYISFLKWYSSISRAIFGYSRRWFFCLYIYLYIRSVRWKLGNSNIRFFLSIFVLSLVLYNALLSKCFTPPNFCHMCIVTTQFITYLKAHAQLLWMPQTLRLKSRHLNNLFIIYKVVTHLSFMLCSLLIHSQPSSFFAHFKTVILNVFYVFQCADEFG